MIRAVRAVLLILGFIIFLNTIISLFFINFNFGFIIFLGVSCILVIYGLFFEKLIRIKWLTGSIIAVCILYVVMMLFIGIYGKSDNVTFNEDAVIVLGAGIRGEQVSLLLAYRLDKAVEYSNKNPNAVIIVSGGQGPQEDITEALAMERYLVDKGIPIERIIKEETSRSTYENLLHSKEILNELLITSYTTAIITNDFHIYRATKLAEIIGLTATHYHAEIKWYYVPLNYSRECLAVFKLWLLGT